MKSALLAALGAFSVCSAPRGRATAPAPAIPAPAPASAAAAPPEPEVWLRGSTHVHALPSGDSRTPIPDVIAWYQSRGYDWIALTDHNRVSEAGGSTAGQPAVRAPAQGLIVLSGIELTHNPAKCLPPGDDSGKCYIHVNLLGPLARSADKVSWAAGAKLPDERLAKYEAALAQQKLLGGVAQLNHPQWRWGMNAELLIALAQRGVRLVEIANAQFERWNRGDAEHPSMEALWDAALSAGVTIYGVASDDAHDYDGAGKYPAGGAWVVVKARRDPQAILDSLAAGRFYASTGVVLERAEVASGELVVETASPGHTIEFIENGVRVATVTDQLARRAVPKRGYVRAVVTRDDGKRAWIQPVRR